MKRLRDLLLVTVFASCASCASCTGSPSPQGSESATVNLLRALPQARLSAQLDRDLSAALAQPNDFLPTAGTWHREADEVRDVSLGSGDAELSALVRPTPEITDATVSAEVRLSPEARVPSGAGLLLRMRDGRNGIGLAVQEGVGVRLVAIREGRAQTLATKSAVVERGRWYALRASIEGAHVRAFLDGQAALEATLPETALGGGIGLFRDRGEGAAFRRLSVGSGDQVEPIDVKFADVPVSIAPLFTASREHRGAALTQPWQALVQTVELKDDSRTSLVLPPDSEIRLPLVLPRRPTLQVDIGVLPSPLAETAGSSRLRIGFENASHEKTWLSTHQVSAEAHWRSWEPATVDLARFDGARGFLVLRNEAIGATGSFVALANPLLRSGSRVGARERPNLILITVDTLRADHLGSYGYSRDTSPFLDAMAARGVVFDEVTAQSSWTKTSMASMFTSTYPERNGVRGADHLLPRDLPTLAEVLGENGYFTAGVQTNPWLLPRSQFPRGFAEYLWLQAAPRAARVNEHALEILGRRGDGPFFLYLHYMDVHHPYMPPTAYRRFGAQPEDAYDGEIRYLDDQLAGLYRSLEDQGLLENTLLVVSSDHGEEFGEHGGSFHGGTLYREQLHVPLMLHWPAHLPTGSRVAGPMRNLDIAPTVLDLLGVAVPSGFQGTSWKERILSAATSTDDDVAVFSQTGLNDVAPDADLLSVALGKWKFIKDRRSVWVRLFDRSVDPAEQHDLSSSDPATRAALERRCTEFLDANRPGRSAKDTAPIDPAVAEQLRSLGYVMSGPAR